MKKHYTFARNFHSDHAEDIRWEWIPRIELHITRHNLKRYEPVWTWCSIDRYGQGIFLHTNNVTFLIKRKDLLDPTLFDGLPEVTANNFRGFDMQAFVNEVIADQLNKSKLLSTGGNNHGSRPVHTKSS